MVELEQGQSRRAMKEIDIFIEGDITGIGRNLVLGKFPEMFCILNPFSFKFLFHLFFMEIYSAIDMNYIHIHIYSHIHVYTYTSICHCIWHSAYTKYTLKEENILCICV